MNELNRSIPCVDGHVDLVYDLMRRYPRTPFPDCGDGHVTLDKLQAARVVAFVTALYCPDIHNGPGIAKAYLEDLFHYARTYLNGVQRIRTRKDLENSYSGDGPPGTFFLLENADALVDFSIETLAGNGVKAVGLTHAGSNRLGDGNAVAAPRGLKPAGKRLLEELGRKGFALDVAHLSEPCFLEAVDLFEGPLLSSHTGFRFFCDSPRNLTAQQTKILLERDGMIGMSINPEMLSRDARAGIEDVIRQVDWFVQRHGASHLGIGTDFGGFDVINLGLEDISKIPVVAERLFGLGYSPDAVRDIMGVNWVRFYSRLFD
ncbi:MAG: membrane dipeptidase [Deltaproteobacteria bacterium]|nr:membrane dipeptidase [Deltaproteobacteria bacterium]